VAPPVPGADGTGGISEQAVARTATADVMRNVTMAAVARWLDHGCLLETPRYAIAGGAS
jgi:hypothetical protein